MKTLASILLSIASVGAVAAQPAAAGDSWVRESLAIAKPDAPVPEARYQSAFGAYPYGIDPKVGAWREKNDLVHRLGGWSAFAKGQVPDAAEPAAAPAASTGKEAQPAAQAHGSHGKR